MWKHENCFTVNVAEREVFNLKIQQAYEKRGKSFSILPHNTLRFPPYIAFMETNHLTGEISFKCGTFWNEEDNILPVMAMTHELGHYIDLTENFNGDVRDYHRSLGTLEMEVRAWEYAFNVCKEIGLEMWDVFYKYSKKCLGSYFNSFGGDFRDKHFGFNGKAPTFKEALKRLQMLTGVEDLEKPEEPRHDFEELLQQVKQFFGERKTAVPSMVQEELEEETDPLKRMMKRKAEAKRQLKKHMGMKPWE